MHNRLTNTSPFLEDDNIPDLRTRISERTVDWDALERAGISEDGKSFITRLLDPRPDCRMTLDAARSHRWLASVADDLAYREEQAPPSIQSSMVLPNDQSMLNNAPDSDSHYVVPGLGGDSVSQGLEQMQLQPGGNNLNREASRPLVRRSDVLSQAAEKDDGGGIMEPSEEMISNSQAQDLADERNAASGSATRKRKEPPADSLIAVPEDEELTPVEGSNGRKNRKVAEAESAAAARSVRGTRAKGAGSPDEEPTNVRRSSRQTPQKAARK